PSLLCGIFLTLISFSLSSSLSLQIVAQSGEAYNEILSRHKIILDLTSCSPPRPLDLSTAPPPAIEFTAPTIPDSSSSYDTCAALQSISNSGTLLCNTIQACTALECDWYSRLEMQVDQCHYPPGIIIIVYDSQNQPSFNRKFNDGSTIVEDGSLPDDLNVTVQQMFPSAISVEVFELARPPTPPPPFNCYSIITKTVIPIDKSSCFTSAPPTTAPTSTCSAMRYVQTALSYSTGDPCFFPVAKNCSILTCPIGKGKDLTLRILRCAHPPAVRITLGTAFSTTFDHTFDHSEVVPLQGVPEEGAALNVTLGQLCSSNSTGLQVDYKSSLRNTPLIPYTVIPIDTTGCGPGSGVTCPDSSDLCKAMNDISDLPFVNRTYIPTTSCSSGTPAASGTTAALVIGLSVGVLFVVLLTLVIIIVVVTVVYLMRRRYYQNYQLAMSQINEDELA
ncbi:hypothetical protein GBAR_LOCUS14183, partial [Geodia barretti]